MYYTENLFLLEGLKESEKKEIKEMLSDVKSFKKGEIIYSAENFKNAIGFIIKGKAFAICNNDSGLRMKSFESKSCFGAAAVFGGDKEYVSSIIADTDIEVLFITESELKNLFLLYPQTSLNYIYFLSEKVRFLNKKLSLLSCSTAEDTVLKYISISANREGFATLPKNMTILSKTLGLGRASLYRSLDNLEAKGLILRENNKVKVIKNEKNS